tara:strand:+ start:2182 stop:2430 length:249 start_codon:yes stop_codon:yes gene_type:complete
MEINTMTKEKQVKAQFNKSARVISDYANDLYFEQPRDGLIKQELITYENVEQGVKRTTVQRVFTTTSDYNDHTTISILPNNI